MLESLWSQYEEITSDVGRLEAQLAELDTGLRRPGARREQPRAATSPGPSSRSGSSCGPTTLGRSPPRRWA